MTKNKALIATPSEDDYVLQAHDISRAVYSLPLMQRRLLYVAMAQLDDAHPELLTVEMQTGDVARALSLVDDKGEVRGDTYMALREAAEGLRSQTISVDTPDGWLVTGWVDRGRWIKSRDIIQIKLSEDIVPYAFQLRGYGILQLKDLGRLQSEYAQRLFELVVSWRGMVGTGGNKPGEWFVDAEFATLRTRYKLGPSKYKLTADFRKNVIDLPVREINEARLGIRIVCDYDHWRRGRKLLGVRLKIKETRPGEPKNVTPATKDEEDEAALEALAEAHPEEFKRIEAGIAAEMKKQASFGFMEDASKLIRKAALDALDKELKAKAPGAKKRGRTPKEKP